MLKEMSKQLWQGKGIDIDKMRLVINEKVDEIVRMIPEMQKIGIDFPMEYVSAALQNMSKAIENRDDYMLADNLFFEWNEIFAVYEEIKSEL